MATKTLQIDIIGTNKGATKAFKEVDDAAGTTEGKLRQLGDTIGPAVATAAAAVVGAVGLALRGAFNAAQESAKIGRETERVLNTTGAAAWTTADQVGDLAQSMSELTGVDDELIQSGGNLLLTFTQIQNRVGEGNDIFNQATAAALDMSTALGTDMKSAAIQVGKALNNPISGITALSRAGVSFTEQQKEQIRTLIESGDILGAQKVILAELAKEFGGAAEAAATPVDKLRVKLGNLQEDVGKALVPAISKAADVISVFTDGFMALPGPIKTATLAIGGLGTGVAGSVLVVSKLVSVFGDSLKPVMDFASKSFQSLAVNVGVITERLTGSADAGMKVASTMAGAVTPALTALGIALGVAAVAMIGFSIYQQKQAKDAAAAAKGQEAYAKALAETTGNVRDHVDQATAQLFMEKRVAGAVLEHGMNLRALGSSISDGTDSWEKYRGTYNRLVQDTGPLISALRSSASAGDAAATEIIRFYDAGKISDTTVKDLVFTLDDLQDQYQGAIASGDKQREVFEGIAGASHNAATAIDRQVSTLKDLAEEIRAQTDPYFAAMRAQEQFNEAQQAYVLTSLDSTKSTDDKKRAYITAAQAGLAYRGELIDLNRAELENGATTQALEGHLKDLAALGLDPTSESAQDVIGDFRGIKTRADELNGSHIKMAVSADTTNAKNKLEEIRNIIRDILGLDNTLTGEYGRGLGITKRAMGGMVPDGLFMVGEQGPELGVKSGDSVRIFSNPDTRRILSTTGVGGAGSGDVNVYVNQPKSSAYEIGRELRWQMAVTR